MLLHGNYCHHASGTCTWTGYLKYMNYTGWNCKKMELEELAVYHYVITKKESSAILRGISN